MEGLDYSEGMLEKARKKTQDLKNVKLQRGDITDMPFSPERFAGVTINQVTMLRMKVALSEEVVHASSIASRAP